jgi:hypothetical protein
MKTVYLPVEGLAEKECYIDEDQQIHAPGLAPTRMSIDDNLIVQVDVGLHTLAKDDLTNRITTAASKWLRAQGKRPSMLADLRKTTKIEVDARQNAAKTYDKLGIEKMAVFGENGLMPYLVILAARLFSNGFMRHFNTEADARAWLARFK